MHGLQNDLELLLMLIGLSDIKFGFDRAFKLNLIHKQKKYIYNLLAFFLSKQKNYLIYFFLFFPWLYDGATVRTDWLFECATEWGSLSIHRNDPRNWYRKDILIFLLK